MVDRHQCAARSDRSCATRRRGSSAGSTRRNPRGVHRVRLAPRRTAAGRAETATKPPTYQRVPSAPRNERPRAGTGRSGPAPGRRRTRDSGSRGSACSNAAARSASRGGGGPTVPRRRPSPRSEWPCGRLGAVRSPNRPSGRVSIRNGLCHARRIELPASVRYADLEEPPRESEVALVVRGNAMIARCRSRGARSSRAHGDRRPSRG